MLADVSTIAAEQRKLIIMNGAQRFDHGRDVRVSALLDPELHLEPPFAPLLAWWQEARRRPVTTGPRGFSEVRFTRGAAERRREQARGPAV